LRLQPRNLYLLQYLIIENGLFSGVINQNVVDQTIELIEY